MKKIIIVILFLVLCVITGTISYNAGKAVVDVAKSITTQEEQVEVQATEDYYKDELNPDCYCKVEDGKYIIRVWCGNSECGHIVELRFDDAKSAYRQATGLINEYTGILTDYNNGVVEEETYSTGEDSDWMMYGTDDDWGTGYSEWNDDAQFILDEAGQTEEEFENTH